MPEIFSLDTLKQNSCNSLAHLDAWIRSLVVDTMTEPSCFFECIAAQDVGEHINYLVSEFGNREIVLTAKDRAQILTTAMISADIDVITALAIALRANQRHWRKTFKELFIFLDQSDQPWAETDVSKLWQKVQHFYEVLDKGKLDPQKDPIKCLLLRQEQLISVAQITGMPPMSEYASMESLHMIFGINS